MSQHIEAKDFPFGKLTKKMSKKGNVQIPLDSLGFKAKVFYDNAYEYVPRKKINKHSKYENQKRQLNFRFKLSCIIDPSHATFEEIGDMRFTKRTEWKKIKYIVYRTKEELTCCICLNKEFVAPQMTFCGHVFCWHCILMHYEKSLKANSCPVCNEVFQINELKTCETLFLPAISQGDKVKLKLKVKMLESKITYNPQTLQQETTFSHIVRMKNSNSLKKFVDQHQKILDQMKKNQDPQTQRYLSQVLEISQKKIDETKKQIEEQKNHTKFHKHEIFVNGILCQTLTAEDLNSEKSISFYQQEEGRYVYLHPICEKYLRKNYTTTMLPLKIQEEVILKEQTEYSGENLKKYNYLNHLPENQDFDFIFIRMNQLIDYKLLNEFEKELQVYKKKKKEIISKEQEYARQLNERYEKEQEYLRQLKKMEQSQFHDIKVPTNMIDLAEIQDTNIFPSLVANRSKSEALTHCDNNKEQNAQNCPSLASVKSKIDPFNPKKDQFPQIQLKIKSTRLEQPKVQQSVQKKLQEIPSSKPRQSVQNVNQSDFPQICFRGQKQQIKMKSKKRNQDQDEKAPIQRKNKKKNKEKFVDVTHKFFQRNQQQ